MNRVVRKVEKGWGVQQVEDILRFIGEKLLQHVATKPKQVSCRVFWGNGAQLSTGERAIAVRREGSSQTTVYFSGKDAGHSRRWKV